jgi:hypothetical protein
MNGRDERVSVHRFASALTYSAEPQGGGPAKSIVQIVD